MSTGQAVGVDRLILHARVSCKWTICSDRSQNTRAEALNLVRKRKGRTPHIVAVTGEPMSGRIASIALGTGDVDCGYHFASEELADGLVAIDAEDSRELLDLAMDSLRAQSSVDKATEGRDRLFVRRQLVEGAIAQM